MNNTKNTKRKYKNIKNLNKHIRHNMYTEMYLTLVDDRVPLTQLCDEYGISKELGRAMVDCGELIEELNDTIL